ncbi:MAG: BolA/IbaG family iron-sulfur metabolism protein [Gammaproteobacteria bacterium]|nr:BolA/IbaG family iron-sulfur metabolism protein [Gammaproteobacteria bacterium]
MNSEQIENLLRTAFPRAQVCVASDDNTHFSAKIVDDGFVGLSRVARHRCVHAAIGPALGREIHAMTFTLRTSAEDAAV